MMVIRHFWQNGNGKRVDKNSLTGESLSKYFGDVNG